MYQLNQLGGELNDFPSVTWDRNEILASWDLNDWTS